MELLTSLKKHLWSFCHKETDRTRLFKAYIILSIYLFYLSIDSRFATKEDLEFRNDLLGRQGLDLRELVIVQLVRIPLGWSVKLDSLNMSAKHVRDVPLCQQKVGYGYRSKLQGCLI